MKKITLVICGLWFVSIGTACAVNTSWYSTDCQADIAEGVKLGVRAIPDSLTKHKEIYCKFTQVIAPNGKPIQIFAQNDISNEQLLYARGLLEFYLEDYPGSRYGADKSAIANNIADSGAILSMMNGADGQYNIPRSAWSVIGQPLYDNETPVIGSDAYINNDYRRRDAAFEEIFHFVHDAGIGVDFPGAPKGAAPEYQKQVRAAATNALPENKALWATQKQMAGWLEEIRQEGSITQEYIASVIDSYYGLWGAFTEKPGGMWGGYVAKTRDEVAQKDPMGYAVLEMFLKPYLTFESRIDPGFEGTFLAHFDSSHPYTHKSQYLVNITLTGDKDSAIVANGQDNRLRGNSGDNHIDGKAGTDTVVFSGASAEYEIKRSGNGLRVRDKGNRDGSDTLMNVERLSFTDKQVDLADL